jgi:hypothetical protein
VKYDPCRINRHFTDQKVVTAMIGRTMRIHKGDLTFCRCHILLLTIACLIQSSPSRSAEMGPAADLKQSAQLNSMTPSGRYLRKRRVTIVVNFTVHPIVSESVEYLGILTFNGTPYGPSTLVLTPGEGTITTNMRWQVISSRRQASARFRLVGIGNSTKNCYEFVDITKDYVLSAPVRRIRRPPLRERTSLN